MNMCEKLEACDIAVRLYSETVTGKKFSDCYNEVIKCVTKDVEEEENVRNT